MIKYIKNNWFKLLGFAVTVGAVLTKQYVLAIVVCTVTVFGPANLKKQ